MIIVNILMMLACISSGDEIEFDMQHTFFYGCVPMTNLNGFYRYKGSLMTPGCEQVAIFTVFSQPVYISPAKVSFNRLN